MEGCSAAASGNTAEATRTVPATHSHSRELCNAHIESSRKSLLTEIFFRHFAGFPISWRSIFNSCLPAKDRTYLAHWPLLLNQLNIFIDVSLFEGQSHYGHYYYNSTFANQDPGVAYGPGDGSA
jgi:hypothetical protein